jgi:HlyD family secretion protein
VQIKPIGVNKQGDITYTVVIAPDQWDERLRWNMTAVATIAAEE